jgi:hypothetical protein
VEYLWLVVDSGVPLGCYEARLDRYQKQVVGFHGAERYCSADLARSGLVVWFGLDVVQRRDWRVYFHAQPDPWADRIGVGLQMDFAEDEAEHCCSERSGLVLAAYQTADEVVGLLEAWC